MRKLRKQRIAILLLTALLLGILPMRQGGGSRAAGKTESVTNLSSPVSATLAPTHTPYEPGVVEQPDKPEDRLRNPRTDSDGNTTWSCVYFGNYWRNDTNGDGVADRKDEKEPIKWRVLSVDGDDAFLLADQNLDCKPYNDTCVDVTWETCTMRSWLNGYGAGSNVCEKDYTSDNFLDNVFSASEQAAIRGTNVVNADNPEYDTEGGNDTTDKVYLLSIDEVKNSSYGFSSDYDMNDKNRRAKNTAYAKSQGAYIDTDKEYDGNGVWWLRSPGCHSDTASHVILNGYVYRYAYAVSSNYAVRPALHLNLSSTSGCSYAGTVSSDGTVITPETPQPVWTERPSVETESGVSTPSVITITYDANGVKYSSGSSVSQTGRYGEPLTIEEWLWGMSPLPYGITYDSNEPTDAILAPIQSQPDPVQEPAPITFQSWNTRPDGSGATFYPGDTYDGGGDLTLYAQYDRTKVVTSLKSSQYLPDYQNYTFIGWYTQRVGGEKASVPMTLTEHVTLYAHWEAVDISVPTPEPSENLPTITPTITPTKQPGSIGGTATARPNASVGQGTSSGMNSEEAEESVPQNIYAKSLTKTYGSRPFILAADADGDGILTYSSSSPKVATISPLGIVTVKGYGKTVITIHAEAMDEYMAAEKKITLTVIPRTVNLKKAGSPARKQMQAVWKSDHSVTGYQIYISKKRDFSRETFQRIYGKSKKKFTLFGLRSRQTYFVKIRAYRKVGKTKYYGKWSKVKAVKVK